MTDYDINKVSPRPMTALEQTQYQWALLRPHNSGAYILAKWVQNNIHCVNLHDDALREAQTVAKCLADEHFSDNDTWKVSDDLVTVILQISNMVTKWRDDKAMHDELVEALEELTAHIERLKLKRKQQKDGAESGSVEGVTYAAQAVTLSMLTICKPYLKLNDLIARAKGETT